MTRRTGIPSLGVLHPGSMGAAIAAQARAKDVEVFWCPEGRSEASQERAFRAGLSPVSDITAMAEQCEVIVSLCPPASAIEVASHVAESGFDGLYIEANAISPGHVTQIGAKFRGKAKVVDGSVIGSPPSADKGTRLYLSGPSEAIEQVAELFSGTSVAVHPLVGGMGKASALKMAYSSYQKASRALAAVAFALANSHGLENELNDIVTGRTTSYLAETTYIPKVAERAWRWAPEMHEVAHALNEASLPSELAKAAASVMERWPNSRGQPLELDEALAHLHELSDERASE